MQAQRLHRLSTLGLLFFSSAALLTVGVGLVMPLLTTGRMPPPEPDEGALAHLFQLFIVALAPIGLAFLATADWTRPFRPLRELVWPGCAVLLAFSILYYFETYGPVAR